MNRAPTYLLEYVFLATVVVVSVLGFWTLYVGPDAAPNTRHHLHVVTNFIWLALLIGQLYLPTASARPRRPAARSASWSACCS